MGFTRDNRLSTLPLSRTNRLIALSHFHQHRLKKLFCSLSQSLMYWQPLRELKLLIFPWKYCFKKSFQFRTVRRAVKTCLKLFQLVFGVFYCNTLWISLFESSTKKFSLIDNCFSLKATSRKRSLKKISVRVKKLFTALISVNFLSPKTREV